MELKHIQLSARDSFTVIPLGDIQWTLDREKVSEKRLLETINHGLEEDAFFLGTGDYVDAVSPSNRAVLRDMYEDTRDFIEAGASMALDDLYHSVLQPTTGCWLSLVEGHHFMEYRDGSTSDTRLARMLQTNHLGTMGYIRVDVTDWPRPVYFLVWHGSGAGQSAGAMANKIDRMRQIAEADVYVMGHMTRLTHVPMNKLVMDPDDPTHLIHRTYHLVGSGGYERGYQDGRREGIVPRGTYVEKQAMRPTALGSPIIRVRPDRITVEI